MSGPGPLNVPGPPPCHFLPRRKQRMVAVSMTVVSLAMGRALTVGPHRRHAPLKARRCHRDRHHIRR